MSFTVLGIVAIVVNLINSLGGAARKLSNKRSSIPLWEKYDIVVWFNSENGTKVAKPARDSDISLTTLPTASKNKDKTIFDFFLSAYTRKHQRVSSNTNQRTFLTLARLWH